jgi:outer membrane protein assembly factor BamB
MTSSTWSTGLPGDVAELRTHPSDIVTATISESAYAGPAVSVLSTADGTERDRVETAGAVKSVVYHEDPGLLLVTTDADRIHAVDPASGGERWAVDAAGVVATTEERIFLSADARVWAYRAADGTVEWETTLPDAVNSGLQRHVRDDCLLVTVGEYKDKGLVALDLDTGVERWYYRPGDAKRFVHDGDAGPYATFAGDDRDGDVARIDVMTGIESWSYTADSSLGYTLSSVGDCLCLEDESAVMAVDAVSGRERWRSSGYRSVYDLWIKNGTPYVVWKTDEYDYGFHALDPDTGRSSWRVETAQPVRWIALDGSDNVYPGTYGTGDNGVAYRIDGTTGRVHWRFETVKSVRGIDADATPTLVGSGESNSRHTLFGVDAADGDPLWTLSDEYLTLVRATPHLVAVSGSADTVYLVRREDGTVERTLDADDTAATDGALFIADGATVAAYALTPSPAAFEEHSGGTGDTVLYVSEDDEAETTVYSDDDQSACPSCGSDLDTYGEVSFCPDCGSDLSADAE